jgi:UDP-N-acetylglucosamine--N-acetylmuramyl-(pentapeptide) pyrophosphoryl-undecaprenol N-acetylglucosamine transferase
LCKTYLVVHQTGKQDAGSADLAPQDRPFSESYRPFAFIKEAMPHLIAAAELVLGRSGAGTIWECASLGKPMALIPLSGSGTRGDQVENAQFLEKAGAAVVLYGEVSPRDLEDLVTALAGDGERRRAMGEAAARFASRDSAEIIAGAIAERALFGVSL